MEQDVKDFFGRIRNEKRFSGKCLPDLASDDEDEYGDFYGFGPTQMHANVLRYVAVRTTTVSCTRVYATQTKSAY